MLPTNVRRRDGCDEGRRLDALRRERGQDAAEFALVFPLLFLMILAIFDFGHAVFSAATLHNAAREGARYASVAPTDTTGIEDVVRYIAVGIPPADLTITVTPAPGGPYDEVQVTVTYDMPLVTPLLGALFGGGNTVTLGGQSRMKTELRLP
jgi:Flp pilus assembly protein TadG